MYACVIGSTRLSCLVDTYSSVSDGVDSVTSPPNSLADNPIV